MIRRVIFKRDSWTSAPVKTSARAQKFWDLWGFSRVLVFGPAKKRLRRFRRHCATSNRYSSKMNRPIRILKKR